jgi:hypothetical protein
MNDAGGQTTKVAATPKDIEDQLELSVADMRREIERNLEDRIQQLKQDAQRKIEQSAEEFAEGKSQLQHYQSMIAELEKESGEVQALIRGHAEKASRTKGDVLKLIDLQNVELSSIRDEMEKLDRLREEAALRANVLSRQLEVKFGLAAKLPEIAVFKDGAGLDALKELERWTKIKDLLGPADVLCPDENENTPKAEPGAESPKPAEPIDVFGEERMADEMRPIFEEDLETIFTEP